MMQFKNGTDVYAATGEKVGDVERVVINPTSNKVSHIVVRKGFLFAEDRVIPIEAVAAATNDKVTLNPAIKDFKKLPKFEQVHYIPYNELSRDDMNAHMEPEPLFWYPRIGVGYANYPYYPAYYGEGVQVTERSIPDESIALQEGADVIDSRGNKVGDVSRVYTNDRDEVAYFIISKGFLFKEEKVIPAHWINLQQEDEIHLDVSADFIERLPEFEGA